MIKKCNVCNKAKPLIFFKKNKKTCRGCERTLGNYLMRMLVKSRKLTPAERIGNRLGYMGTAFIMMSPYLLPYDNIGAYTYLLVPFTTYMFNHTAVDYTGYEQSQFFR